MRCLSGVCCEAIQCVMLEGVDDGGQVSRLEEGKRTSGTWRGCDVVSKRRRAAGSGRAAADGAHEGRSFEVVQTC